MGQQRKRMVGLSKMFEQEFIDTLENAGFEKNEIMGFIDIYNKLKKNHPDLTLSEWANKALESKEKVKNEPKGFFVD